MNCVFVKVALALFLNNDTPEYIRIDKCKNKDKAILIKTGKEVEVVKFQDNLYYIRNKNEK